MGEKNKANRTKGNTRPSSSDHSAQLLTSSGKSLSGFVGFDSLEKDIPYYIPVTGQHLSDAVDISVDSDLRMVMRKMLKRDNVTRLKAIQEFGDLCATKDTDSVKNVLPFWPRLFNKLALDHDRRVREATHQANGKLIANVKREIAPYLKNIMGVWLLGQNDLHAPAASAAQASFIETFPKNKQPEALMHCKNETFSLFKDNLFEQTAKTLSDPNTSTAEDIENKYTLVISATLQALKLFLLTISSNEISDVQDDYLSVVSDNKFWKYAKSKEPQIRGSWYALISILCHMKPTIFAEMEKKLLIAVFGCLSESDPVVASTIWEAALHIVVNFENCWQGVNLQKVVLPQLWSMLNEAGRGNAHVVYPCLLPFLSKFPKDIISKESFLLQFFTSLKQSLLQDCIKLSPMECDAILTTFMECLQYISFCVLDSAKEGCSLLEKVFSEHILPLVEISFYESRYSYIATSKLYPLLGSLVQKIEKKSSSDDKEKNKAFSATLTLFWLEVFKFFCKIFDKKDKDKAQISVYATYFFHSIFGESSSVKVEKSKVRFEDEVKPSEVTQVSSDILPSRDMYKEMPISFMHIIQFIKVLCNKTDESVNLCYLKILDEILASTLNTEFLKDILASFEDSADVSEKASLTFFRKIILKWISAGALDESSVTCISDIVFSLCSSVSEEEALDMLNTSCEGKNPVFVENILNKGINVHADEPVIQKWLKGDTLIKYIVNGLQETMESFLKNEVPTEKYVTAHKNMMIMCILHKDLRATLKKVKSIEDILIVCKDCLGKGANSENADSIIQTSCGIVKAMLLNIEDCFNFTAMHDLLSVLFNWILHSESINFSEKASTEIYDVWNTAIQSWYKSSTVTMKNSFVLRAAKELKSSICNLQTSKKASKTFHEALNLLYMIENILSSLPDCYSSPLVLSELLENVLPSDDDWQKLREGLVFSMLPAVMQRKIAYSFHEEQHSVSQDDVCKLFLATKLVSQIFAEEMEKNKLCDDEQYFEQYMWQHVPNLFWCLSYCSGNGYMSRVSETKLDVNILEKHCTKILKFASYEKLRELLADMFNRSCLDGLLWALPFQLFMEKLKGYDIAFKEEIIDELFFKVANRSRKEPTALCVQILRDHISLENKRGYLKSLLLSMAKYNDPYEAQNDYTEKLRDICCFIHDSEIVDDDVKSFFPLFFGVLSQFEPTNDPYVFFTEYVLLMSSLLQYSPTLITVDAWHTLQSLLSSHIKLGKTKKFDRADDFLFLFEVSLAYTTLHSFVSSNNSTEITKSSSKLEELNKDFISLIIHIGGVIYKFHPLPQAFNIALCNLVKAVECVPENVLFNYAVQACEGTSAFKSKNDKTPLDSLLCIQLSDIQHLQLSAHIMLMKIVPFLSESVAAEAKNESDDTEDVEEITPTKILPLVDTLNILNEPMESMLSDIQIGECCIVLPNTESYAFVSAYFFTWLQVLEYISKSPSQKRSGYVAHLEKNKLLSSLLNNVCRLMPEDPMLCFKKATGTESPKKENLTSLFLHPPRITPGNQSSEEIQIMSCYVFCTAMRRVPASVRTWGNNLDKISSALVNGFTSKYISEILCAEEIQAVRESDNPFKNMTVKARLGSKEVIATYTVDDFAIELCVQLPSNYPLGPITAEKHGKIIIPKQEWRRWLMQLSTVLNYQNGSIMDGLSIWKKNLDKKFEGVEECMICYYILHSSTLKMPQLSCNTCRKKFHSACLYKWFQSINNTKCPLCRSDFIV